MSESLSKYATVESSIRILRKGKQDPRWQAAAQFLIDRAAPDVKLLLEAAREFERQKLTGPQKTHWKVIATYAAILVVAVVITIALVANLELNKC